MIKNSCSFALFIFVYPMASALSVKVNPALSYAVIVSQAVTLTNSQSYRYFY